MDLVCTNEASSLQLHIEIFVDIIVFEYKHTCDRNLDYRFSVASSEEHMAQMISHVWHLGWLPVADKEPWKYLRTTCFSPQEMGPWIGACQELAGLKNATCSRDLQIFPLVGVQLMEWTQVICNFDPIDMFCSAWNMRPNKWVYLSRKTFDVFLSLQILFQRRMAQHGPKALWTFHCAGRLVTTQTISNPKQLGLVSPALQIQENVAGIQPLKACDKLTSNQSLPVV